MKIACISDTHGIFLPDIEPDTDVILHAGDIGPDRGASDWFLKEFRHWCDEHRKPVYFTWGNHDFIGQRLPEDRLNQILPPEATLCVDELVTIKDPRKDAELKVWFSPWSNLFGDWAWMLLESGLAEKYARIPDETDMIVSHGPPKGYGDRTFYQNVGSTSLLKRFFELPNACYLICGHIHEAHGTYYPDQPGKVIINCSQVNEKYQPLYNAVRYLTTNSHYPYI